MANEFIRPLYSIFGSIAEQMTHKASAFSYLVNQEEREAQ